MRTVSFGSSIRAVAIESDASAVRQELTRKGIADNQIFYGPLSGTFHIETTTPEEDAVTISTLTKRGISAVVSAGPRSKALAREYSHEIHSLLDVLG